MIDEKNYAWLDTVGVLPRMVAEARALLGTVEFDGSANNPKIMKWTEEVGMGTGDVITADSVPWCGLFMAFVAKRAGKTPPSKPCWALNWSKFGEDGGQPELGDVLTFHRKTKTGIAGHVALYIGQDDAAFHVLGGNQTNCVCFTRIEKERLVAVRQPLYMTRPASVAPYILAAKGGLSTGEG